MDFKCCRECTKRIPGCHGECEEYAAAKKAFDAERDKVKKGRQAENEVMVARRNAIRKVMRKK